MCGGAVYSESVGAGAPNELRGEIEREKNESASARRTRLIEDPLTPSRCHVVVEFKLFERVRRETESWEERKRQEDESRRERTKSMFARLRLSQPVLLSTGVT